MRVLFFLVGVWIAASGAWAGSTVSFDPAGNAVVDGKPFFPIGVWVYGIDPNVMADLHEHQFNTIVGGGINPRDVKVIEEHGMMMIPLATDEFRAAGKDSKALLGWYLEDEPEEHNVKPEDLKKKFDALKKKELTHPIGVTHNQLSGPERYKDSGDFTMTDVYPVTAKRDWPLNAVGIYAGEPKRVHGEGWPVFTFVQTFGGPETDGGLWAQPRPDEVRLMAFNALVHRANGIFYFSYWPKAAATWSEVGKINRDIHRLAPWLLAKGEEKKAIASEKDVEVRAKKVGESWLVIVTNGNRRAVSAEVSVEGLGDAAMRMPFESGGEVKVSGGKWEEKLGALGVRVFWVGKEPES